MRSDLGQTALYASCKQIIWCHYRRCFTRHLVLSFGFLRYADDTRPVCPGSVRYRVISWGVHTRRRAVHPCISTSGHTSVVWGSPSGLIFTSWVGFSTHWALSCFRFVGCCTVALLGATALTFRRRCGSVVFQQKRYIDCTCVHVFLQHTCNCDP